MKFSTEHLNVLCNSQFLLTKQKLLEYIYEQLSHWQSWHLSYVKVYEQYTAGVFRKPLSGKISRGENYRGLPYLVLDAPRFFTPEDVFAIRIMFWWGNDFSYTLHLAGKPLEMYRASLKKKLVELAENEVFFCVNPSPWEYHFEEDNYQKLAAAPTEMIEAHLFQKNFVKLSRKLPITDFEKFNDFVEESFSLFLID